MESTDLEKYDAIIFDRDGTLIQSSNPNSKFCSGFDFELMDHRWGALQMLRQSQSLAVCSNQGGVAAGFKSIEQLYCEAGYLNGLLDFPMLQIYCVDQVGAIGREVVMIEASGKAYQLYFRDSDIGYRKPDPGMLLLAKKECHAQACLYIGDRTEDQQAASNAGWDFCHADDFPWERLARAVSPSLQGFRRSP